ncbi:hypothetical protein L598_002800000050 [Mesorhizobium sp. J18]|nr:hypothetical protein L598_002800000050 [Mesorhizobium sp. J18]
MEPKEGSACRRHRAKSRGTPLRGWRHEAGALLQGRQKAGLVFEATDQVETGTRPLCSCGRNDMLEAPSTIPLTSCHPCQKSVITEAFAGADFASLPAVVLQLCQSENTVKGNIRQGRSTLPERLARLAGNCQRCPILSLRQPAQFPDPCQGVRQLYITKGSHGRTALPVFTGLVRSHKRSATSSPEPSVGIEGRRKSNSLSRQRATS